MTWLTSLTNLSLRAFSLAARFLLSIFMVNYFVLDEIGMFGLIVSVTAGAPAILGFGLNYFINREIVAMPQNRGIAHLRDRLAFTFVCSTIVAAVFAIGMNFVDPIPMMPSLWLLLPVFVLETLAIDLHFGLVSIKRSVLANLLLFFRSAIWVYPFMLLAWISPQLRNLTWLLGFWLSGQIVLVLALYIHSRDWRLKKFFEISPDMTWLWSFAKRSKLVYFSDIAIFFSMFFDRFFLGGLLGLTDLGIFVFCATVSGSVYLLASAAIIQNMMPILADEVRSKNIKKLNYIFYLHLKKAVVMAIALSSIVFFLFGFLVDTLGRPELKGHNSLMIIMLTSVVLKLCSDAFNQLMHALHLDIKWSLINILSMGLIVGFTLLLAPTIGMSGAAIATTLTWIIVIFVRRYFCTREMQALNLNSVT